MTFIRSLIYVAWLYGSLAVVGAAFLPLALFSSRAASDAARVWSKTALWGVRTICGLRVEVRGREYIPQGAALIASKHQAMLDTLLPFTLLSDPSVAQKQELAALPIFGWYSKRARMMVLDRGGHAGALRKMMREARVYIEQGRQLWIFPEGTRQEPGAAPDYKSGVAALYLYLKVPCTPVALNTGLYWPAHGVTRKPGLAIMEFLPPIPAGLSRDDFMAALQERIETRSNELLAQPAHAHAPA